MSIIVIFLHPIRTHSCIILSFFKHTNRKERPLSTAATTDPKEYALRLKEAMGEAGIYSARELARLLDVQEQTVKQWYNGKSRPNGKNLTNLLALLRVDEAQLLHGRSKSDKLAAPPQCADPVDDFHAALAVINGMAGLLLERTQEIPHGDANKVGRTLLRASENADRAFKILTRLYSEKCQQ